jgi:hypothetical protein
LEGLALNWPDLRGLVVLITGFALGNVHEFVWREAMCLADAVGVVFAVFFSLASRLR